MKLDCVKKAVSIANQLLERPLLNNSAIATQDEYLISVWDEITAVMSSHENGKTMAPGYADGPKTEPAMCLRELMSSPLKMSSSTNTEIRE